MKVPPDPGLQPERTSLAWRRTAMSVAVGSLSLAKVLPPGLQAVSLLVCVVGLGWFLDLVIASRRRYRDGLAALAGEHHRAPTAHILRTATVAGLVGVASAFLVTRMVIG